MRYIHTIGVPLKRMKICASVLRKCYNNGIRHEKNLQTRRAFLWIGWHRLSCKIEVMNLKELKEKDKEKMKRREIELSDENNRIV